MAQPQDITECVFRKTWYEKKDKDHKPSFMLKKAVVFPECICFDDLFHKGFSKDVGQTEGQP